MDFTKYNNTKPYTTDPEGHEKFLEEERRLQGLFRQDVIWETGLQGHPKAGEAFRFARKCTIRSNIRGKTKKQEALFEYLTEIAELLKA